MPIRSCQLIHANSIHEKGVFYLLGRGWSAFPPSLQVALRDEMRLALFRNRFSAIEHSDISAAPRNRFSAISAAQRRTLADCFC